MTDMKTAITGCLSELAESRGSGENKPAVPDFETRVIENLRGAPNEEALIEVLKGWHLVDQNTTRPTDYDIPLELQLSTSERMGELTAQEAAIIRSSIKNAFHQSILEDVKLANIKRKLKLEEKYGVTVSESEMYSVMEADRGLTECQQCMYKFGMCNKYKAQDKYWLPTIKVVAGKVVLGKVRCPGWKYYINEQCDRAGIPKRYLGKTLADYNETAENREALEMTRWYLEEYPKDCGLYFYGGPGTGKTLLASIIAREMICAGRKVIFGDVPDLLKKIKERFDYGAFARYEDNLTAQMVLDKYMATEFLVLDDIGSGQMTQWSVGVMYQILNERYNAGKRTLITSNYDLDGLKRRLTVAGAEMEAEKIISRIIGSCEQGYFGKRDRRRERRYA